jgi:hypothetical protein
VGESKTGRRATNLLMRTIVWQGCRWDCREVLDSSLVAESKTNKGATNLLTRTIVETGMPSGS